ncbi:MAG TPA: peptide ABC transporter substrate-binding protein [Firmicutes bacterium]|nr:peptide ABC transporter substrate-binding protein [Bacillota bacterium]HBK59926.1 peptide ABC transporter substrate-binding protein [Bacillota bacterium]
MTDVLLHVENLVKHFPIMQGTIVQRQVGVVRAVDGLSFDVHRGETLGLVGESGCGKSTTGKLIMGLERPTSGEITFDGLDIVGMSKKGLRAVRREMQIVFQDPFASLNPRMSVAQIIGEPFRIHRVCQKSERERCVLELLEQVGLDRSYSSRYPREFSGGQRQRIGVARALALNPKLIICDEPVSALDVSVQAQVINLLQDLQQERGLTYILIAHDLGVVKHVSDRVAVMYLGQIVELASTSALYSAPRHPYTQALMAAIPIPDPKAKRDRALLEGDVPSPINPPSGCRFHPRCSSARQICRQMEPEFTNLGDGHYCACHVQTRSG